MRKWTGSSLVQVMACRLFGDEPLPEPMLAHCRLDSWEQISVEFESEFYHFHSRIFFWKCRLPKWRPFVRGRGGGGGGGDGHLSGGAPGGGGGHYELPMEKKVPWNGAVSMHSRAGSWKTWSICIMLRHNRWAPADMHANALGILIICRFPLA